MTRYRTKKEEPPMFKKGLPLALIAIAGCVALSPTAQKTDSTAQSASPTSVPTSQTAQKASPTPVPTPTPTPSPTPKPTPLPDNILKISFVPVKDVPDLEVCANDPWNTGSQVFFGKNKIYPTSFHGIARSASGDMYLQVGIPSGSIPVFCPSCEMKNIANGGHRAIFKKTRAKDEFEYVAMAGKQTYKKEDGGQTPYFYEYSRYDFTFSKLAEAASVSMAPWVVKSVDFAKKEISFDTGVWPQNTIPLVLSDVATGDFFGQDYDNYQEGWNSTTPCGDVACENERALAVVRERTAFTGTKAYFIGRAKSNKGDSSILFRGSNKFHTIFRISETGAKEIVAKGIAAYFLDTNVFLSGEDTELVHNFAYSRADNKFYIITATQGMYNRLYRVSEDALVP